MSWKQLDRKTVIDNKFLKVFEDKIELPNGSIIPDYSVIEKQSFVMVVALDPEGNLITIDEYKYAIDQTIHTLPAGCINWGESPLETAKRELREETGYSGGTWEYLGEYYDYPSKDSHIAHFVKVAGVSKTEKTNHEDTENISLRVISLAELKGEISKNEWRANGVLAALVAARILS
jgi:8-oxo-dGTP pyrophosphatase MutT (NUDIX family)